jgi:hypothetical protein
MVVMWNERGDVKAHEADKSGRITGSDDRDALHAM